MTDREHRIDTGSPEERVRAKYPDAHESYGIYLVRIIPDYRNPYKRRKSIGKGKSEAEAWADAASRLETK